MSTSGDEHRARMDRGIEAVREYLGEGFPGYAVQVLEASDRDKTRGTRTFKVRDDGEKYPLRVVDEVLDLDIEGVSRILHQFRVVRALSGAGPSNAFLVTTNEVRIEPIEVERSRPR